MVGFLQFFALPFTWFIRDNIFRTAHVYALSFGSCCGLARTRVALFPTFCLAVCACSLRAGFVAHRVSGSYWFYHYTLVHIILLLPVLFLTHIPILLLFFSFSSHTIFRLLPRLRSLPAVLLSFIATFCTPASPYLPAILRGVSPLVHILSPFHAAFRSAIFGSTCLGRFY